MNQVDRVITDEYERYKAEVLRTVSSKLRASGARIDSGELEAPYNEAWHALYMKMSDGEEIGNRVGFLVTVTHRRALSEYRATRPGRRADDVDLNALGSEVDLDAQLDAEIKVRHVVEGLKANLSEREFEAATLCHLHGFSRPEAAEAIGVKPKRMEKIMDGASDRIATVIERVRTGEHCEAMDSQVRAYAVGMLDPHGDRYAQTEDHLSHCPACRRQVWVLRGLAAGVPPIPAIISLAGGSAATGGVVAGGMRAGTSKPNLIGSAHKGTKVGKGTGTAVAVSAVAVVAVVAAVATGAIGGGGGSEQSESPSASSLAVSKGGPTSSQKATVARKKAIAAARVKAAAKKRALKIERQQRAARNAEIAAVSEPAPEPAYVPPVPEPAYVPPAPEPEPARPDPTPTPDPVKPQPQPEPPVKPVKPTINAGDEFGLR